jgi:hypothetical protein
MNGEVKRKIAEALEANAVSGHDHLNHLVMITAAIAGDGGSAGAENVVDLALIMYDELIDRITE